MRRSESTAREPDRREEEEELEQGSVSINSEKLSMHQRPSTGGGGREAGPGEDGPTIAPIQSNTPSRYGKSLRSIRSHHSQAGADGYTYFANEDDDDGHRAREKQQSGKSGGDQDGGDEPYLVRFEGDADPMNPRSMATWRRWVIVLICSVSSLCV